MVMYEQAAVGLSDGLEFNTCKTTIAAKHKDRQEKGRADAQVNPSV
jgi:hypothetical protein